MSYLPTAPTRSCRALLLTVLWISGPAAFADDDFWIGAGSDALFQNPANWDDFSPPGPGDRAFFQLGGDYDVQWNNATGDSVQNTDLVVEGGSPRFFGVDGSHTYGIEFSTLIDAGANLTLDLIELNMPGGSLTVERGALNIVGGARVHSQNGFVGPDNRGEFSFGSAVVSGPGSTWDSGNITLGSPEENTGRGSLTVELGGALDADSVSVSGNSDLQITDNDSDAAIGSLRVESAFASVSGGADLTADFVTLGDGAFGTLSISGSGTTADIGSVFLFNGGSLTVDSAASVGPAGPSVSGPNVSMSGGELQVRSGAQMTGLANLYTFSFPGNFANGQSQSGPATITIDGVGSRVEFTHQSPSQVTGFGLGIGGMSDMTVSGGAVVEIGPSGWAGVSSGFSVGEDPAGLFFTQAAATDQATLIVDGAGSRIDVTGSDIAAYVGSAGWSAQVAVANGISGAINGGGNGILDITNGGVVSLNGTAGGFARMVVADVAGSTGTVTVSGPGSTLDAGDFLYLGLAGLGNTNGGAAVLEVDSGGQVIATNLAVGRTASATIRGANSVLTTARSDQGNLSVYGELALTGGATLDVGVPNGTLNIVGGSATLASGARVISAQQIFLGQDFSNPGATSTLSIDSATVNLDQQSANQSTGLVVGFGGNNFASITGGSVVTIGESGIAGLASGFAVGSNVPTILGGPAVGSSTLAVAGFGTELIATGSNVLGSVGSATPFIDFFDQFRDLYGLGTAAIDNPGANGTLTVTGGARVMLEETAGGSSALIVADSANAQGVVRVAGFGSQLDAGQLLALGVDALEDTAGQGILTVQDRGEVLADRLVVGGRSLLTLDGGILTAGEVVGAADNFAFTRGTLNITDSALNFGPAGLLGDSFTLDTNRRINVAQDVVVGTGAVLELASNNLTANGLLNLGEVVVNANKVAGGVGLFQNSGRVTGDGQVDAQLNNSSGGEIRATNGNELRFAGAGNVNSGAINLLGGVVEFTADLTNQAGGSINGQGTLIVAGGLDNQGAVSFSALASNVFGDVDHTGSIRVSGNSTVTFYDDVVNNGTEFRVSLGSLGVFLGDYSGASGFSGLGTVLFDGTTNGGNSPATTRVEGDTIFGSGNLFIVEIGGKLAGDEFDRWDSGGETVLDGVLKIELTDGFLPDVGDTFEILRAGQGVFGLFSQVLFPDLPGLEFLLSQTSNELLLSVVAAPVPLPAAVWLLGSAVLCLAGFRGRGSTRAAPA